MKVGAIQYRTRDIDSIEQFEKHIEALLKEAAQKEAELVLFPEFFTVELLTLEKHKISEMKDIQQIFAAFGKNYTEFIKELFTGLAAKYHMAIAAGSHFCYREEEDRYYNTSFVFLPAGSTFSQDKIHLSYELVYNKEMTSPGKQLNVFDLNGVKCGIAICYDNSFPEVARILAKQGAEIILAPTCCLDSWGAERNMLFARARACENQVFVVNSQLVGAISFPTHIPYGFLFNGQSGIYEPIQAMRGSDTGILCMCERNREQVIVYDVDVDGLRRSRDRGANCNIHDMRLDIYKNYM